MGRQHRQEQQVDDRRYQEALALIEPLPQAMPFPTPFKFSLR
jgi:hypothetical protein